MREILTIIKGNIRKNKGASISIFVLMLLVALSLMTVLTIYVNTQGRYDEASVETGFESDLALLNMYAFDENQTDVETLIAEMEACDDLVTDVQDIPAIYMNLTDANGHSDNNTHTFIDYKSEYLHYNMYDADGKLIEDPVLLPGEISVPISFQVNYGCQIGDTIYYGGDEESHAFRIASFMEDPVMGCFVIGIKSVLICEEDMEMLNERAEQTNMVEKGMLLNIIPNDTYMNDKQDADLERDLNNRTNLSAYAWVSITKDASRRYTMIYIDVFFAIILSFIILLLIVAFILLNHNINSNIELDYMNLGILKAVGVSNRTLRLSIIWQYLFAGIAGMICGSFLAIPFVNFVHEQIIPIAGLYIRNRLSILPGICFYIIMLGIMVLFIVLKLRKLAEITPVRAINQGKKDVHFSSVLMLPISKKLLDLSVTYRQLISNKKQYIGTTIITALMVMFLIIMNQVCSLFDNTEIVSKLFSMAEYDMYCGYASEEIKQEAEDYIRSQSDIEIFHMGNEYIIFEDAQIYCYRTDRPEFINVYEGRSCLYENEVAITEYIAEEFHIKIGDTVLLSTGDEAIEYIVTGYYQSGNDMGRNIAISSEGYLRLTGKEPTWRGNYYRIENSEKTAAIVNYLQTTYDETQMDVEQFTALDEMGEVFQYATYGVTLLMYVLAAAFVIVNIVMMCLKIFAVEQKDYGIYKAQGFTSKRLRNQLATRLAFVALFGSLLGGILSVLFANSMIGSVFRMVGVRNFQMDIRFGSVIIPLIFMAILYYLFAYALSGRIKRVQPRILIVE